MFLSYFRFSNTISTNTDLKMNFLREYFSKVFILFHPFCKEVKLTNRTFFKLCSWYFTFGPIYIISFSLISYSDRNRIFLSARTFPNLCWSSLQHFITKIICFVDITFYYKNSFLCSLQHFITTIICSRNNATKCHLITSYFFVSGVSNTIVLRLI